jgi:hypothetical protein
VIDLERLRRNAEEAIARAFPPTDPPSPAEMKNDHCPECRESVARLSGKAVHEVELKDLLGNPHPAVLTTAGFRYYLPVMMSLALRYPRELDCFPDSVIGELSPKGVVVGAASDRLTFTRPQAGAILAFLRFYEILRKVESCEPGWPDDAILAVPTDRPLERALRFWSGRVSEDPA